MYIKKLKPASKMTDRTLIICHDIRFQRRKKHALKREGMNYEFF